MKLPLVFVFCFVLLCLGETLRLDHKNNVAPPVNSRLLENQSQSPILRDNYELAQRRQFEVLLGVSR